MTNNLAMIVDDNGDMRALMTTHLRHLGFSVGTFATCHEAISAVDRGYLPALVVIDFELNDEITGDILITALQKMLGKCAYILWTAHEAGKEMADALSCLWLSKSSDRDEIASLLKEAGYEHS